MGPVLWDTLIPRTTLAITLRADEGHRVPRMGMGSTLAQGVTHAELLRCLWTVTRPTPTTASDVCQCCGIRTNRGPFMVMWDGDMPSSRPVVGRRGITNTEHWSLQALFVPWSLDPPLPAPRTCRTALMVPGLVLLSAGDVVVWYCTWSSRFSPPYG